MKKRKTKRMVEKIAPKPKAPDPVAVLSGTTQPVQMKLTAMERRALDRLVENRHYPTRSAALRAGLGLLFDKHGCVTPAEEQVIERERDYHQPRDRFAWRRAN